MTLLAIPASFGEHPHAYRVGHRGDCIVVDALLREIARNFDDQVLGAENVIDPHRDQTCRKVAVRAGRADTGGGRAVSGLLELAERVLLH